MPRNSGKADRIGRTVLVIDDDETALNLMRRRLNQHGYDVLTATSGDAGLAIARSEKPDLILLDIFMPGKSGYEVLDELRQDEAIRSTPVIVTTVDDDRLRGLRLGATDYLTKPVPKDQLGKVLSTYDERLDGEILVIDQDHAASAAIVRMAAQIGLQARCAFEGNEGLRMLREKLPTAVILDPALPGIDGFHIIEEIQQDEALRAVPVIILSATAMDLGEHEAITRAGCTYFPKRDVSPRQIAQSLKLALAA